jgi:mediator of RNA polymerase II transcription subunit 7
MEQGENGPSLSSAFPPPPPFYKFFTSENLRLLKSGNPPESPEKKRELQYLVPPAPPTEGSYSTFGDVWPVSSYPFSLIL